MLKKVLANIILKKLISHSSSCVHSQTVAVRSCSYLHKSRTKSYYLYIKNYTSTSSKEEVAVFLNIFCLTQRKQKHLLRLQANAPFFTTLHGSFSTVFKGKIVSINWGKKMCKDLRLKLVKAWVVMFPVWIVSWRLHFFKKKRITQLNCKKL